MSDAPTLWLREDVPVADPEPRTDDSAAHRRVAAMLRFLRAE